jgi:hypothetical protein
MVAPSSDEDKKEKSRRAANRTRDHTFAAECCLSFSRLPAYSNFVRANRQSVPGTETRVAKASVGFHRKSAKAESTHYKALNGAADNSDCSHRRLVVRRVATLGPQPSKRVFGPRFGTGFEPVTASF